MQATVTYTGGKSCWIRKNRFKLNKAETITCPRVIKLCQNTAGFSVDIHEPVAPAPAAVRRPLETAPVEKVIREVVDAPPQATARNGARRTKAKKKARRRPA